MEQWEAVKPIGPAWMVMGSNAPTPPATRIPCVTGKYMIAPLGSNLAFLGYGPTSTAAQAAAVNLLNITGAAQNCLPITWGPPADAPRVFTLSPDLFFCALTQPGSPTAPIIIIPADGM